MRNLNLKLALSPLAALLVLGGFSTQSFAQGNDAYVSIGATTYEWDTVGLDGKLGYNFNEFFSVEGQGIVGLSSDTETIGGVEVKTKADYTIAGFGVLRFPVTPELEIFGRGGYHQTGLSVETAGVKVDGDIDGFAYGGGVQYNVSNLNSIRAEFTKLDADGGDLDTFSVGYVRKF
jgi:opacity protein-like surface antigen